MSRTTRSAVALGVLVAVFVIGTFIGIRLLTAPLPELPQEQAASCQPRTIRAGDTLKASDVTVDVYNASAISGLANRAMLALGKAHFQPGSIANLPGKVEAGKHITILTRDRRADPVRLVAKQFKGKVRYDDHRVASDGSVQVVVGEKYSGVHKHAPRKVRTKDPTKVCIPVVPEA